MGTCASGADVKSGGDPDEMVLVDNESWSRITGNMNDWLGWFVSFFTGRYVKASDLCALNPEDPPDIDFLSLLGSVGHDPFALLQWNEWWDKKVTYANFVDKCVCLSPGAFSCTTLLNHPWGGANTSGDLQNYRFGVEFVPSVDLWCYGGYLEVASVGSGVMRHGIVESGGFSLNYLVDVTPTVGDHTFFFPIPQHLFGGHTYKYYYQTAYTGWTMKQDSFNTTPTTIAGVYYSQHVYQSDLTSPWITHPNATTSPDPLFCPDPAMPPMPTDVVQPPELDLPTLDVCSAATTATLCAALTLVNERLLWLMRQVTVLQRRELPFTALPGTPATGLTSSGTLPVQDIVGAIVEIIARPPTWGQTAETPPRLIPSVGSLQLSDGTSVGEQRQVHYDLEQFEFDGSLATELVYNFRPGITATVTLLYPAP
jgi:hypothetical protein